MSTRTLGTAGTTTFTALKYQRAPNASGTEQMADFATIAQAILDDGQDFPAGDNTGTSPVAGILDYRASTSKGPVPGAFQLNGRLLIPNRGILMVLPGDFVAVDPNTGWPILISAACAAGAGIVHT
jgi:hypothetical protein